MTVGDDAVTWAVASGAREAAVLAAWGRGRAAAVPTGRRRDVVRVVRTIGLDAVLRLRARGVVLGPVLEVPLREALEFLVPLGTAAVWPVLPGTTCAGPGSTRCPAPHLNLERGQRAACHRRWIVPPGGPPTTDSDELAEAITAAAAHRALAWLGQLDTRALSPKAAR